jgi:NosR/NirI family nitrous oxide reductase transcriptional regulator
MRAGLLIVTIGMAALGALAGWWSGPFLARSNLTVQVAARVALEDSQGLQERTLESEAFRAGGRPAQDLYSEAAQVVERFRFGAALLGAFCGLVLGLKLLGQTTAERPHDYTIDQDECLSCGRCFMACPRERLRLKKAKANG